MLNQTGVFNAEVVVGLWPQLEPFFLIQFCQTLELSIDAHQLNFYLSSGS